MGRRGPRLFGKTCEACYFLGRFTVRRSFAFPGRVGGLSALSAASALESAGDDEGHFEGLFVIEPGIDVASVISLEVFFGKLSCAADALGYIFAGEFKMHAAQLGSLAFMDVEGPLQFA